MTKASEMDLQEARAEVERLRRVLSAAMEETDGGCAFCEPDPWSERHGEDCEGRMARETEGWGE